MQRFIWSMSMMQLTNRSCFRTSVHLNISHMMLKSGKNKKVRVRHALMTNIIVVLFLVFRTLTFAGGRHIKLKRLYFVWVCRHIESFQWFVDLLHSLHNKVRLYWGILGRHICYSPAIIVGSYWGILSTARGYSFSQYGLTQAGE